MRSFTRRRTTIVNPITTAIDKTNTIPTLAAATLSARSSAACLACNSSCWFCRISSTSERV